MEKVYEKQRKKAASTYMRERLLPIYPKADNDSDDCEINWAFQSGADWEHERAEVLVAALQYYAGPGKFAAEPNTKIATDALKKYGNKS